MREEMIRRGIEEPAMELFNPSPRPLDRARPARPAMSPLVVPPH